MIEYFQEKILQSKYVKNTFFKNVTWGHLSFSEDILINFSKYESSTLKILLISHQHSLG